MLKKINLIPFNKESKLLEVNGSGIEIEVESKSDFLKDFIIISCQDKKAIRKLELNIESLKNELNLENKLIIFNCYENPEERVSFFMLKEEDVETNLSLSSFIL